MSTGADAPRADEHTPAHEEQAALYALRLLEAGELDVYRRHLQACGRCQAIVEQDRATAAALAAAAPEMEPSPDFRARLLARAAAEPPPEPEHQEDGPTRPPVPASLPTTRLVEPTPIRRTAAPGRPLQRWLLPLAAVLVAAGALAIAVREQQTRAQQAIVASVPLEGRVAQGAATVHVRRDGQAEVQLQGLPDPPAGQVYQAWVIGQDGVPVPAGSAPAGSGSLRLLQPPAGKTVALTLEQPGAGTPSSPPILMGVVPA